MCIRDSYVDYAAAVLRIPSMGCTRPGGGGGMTGINPSQGCDNGCGDDGIYGSATISAPDNTTMGRFGVFSNTISGCAKGINLGDMPPGTRRVLPELLEAHSTRLKRLRGDVITRTTLSEHLYGDDKELISNAIDVHVASLRRKLGAALIQTRRGSGYLIDA